MGESRSGLTKRPTINDIARAAGVSSAAVSYALNDSPGVGPELRKRIRGIADELGYRPSPLARRLKTGRSRSIGLLLADITNPFYTEMAGGAVEAASVEGYEVSISHLGGSSSRLVEAARGHVDRYESGLLLTSLMEGDGALLDELRAARVPVVQLYRRVVDQPLDWVGIDDRSAAEEIATVLLATGRRRIALLAGPPTSSASAARARGFRDGLRRAGLRAVNEPDVWGEITRRSGFDRATALFAAGTDIEAIICGNDVIALGVLDACRDTGRSVPDDLALTGFDGMEFASVGPLQLTTVVVPREEIGRRGVRLLLRRIAGEDHPPVDEMLPYELQVRTTTTGPATGTA
jgi:LacI family transcriptional regulator